ncbi:low affinity immunoglobulin gamma Fc region receptor II-like [Trachinotus anak]|uniref:low affinity immunoglobulin gamma Fc region receptor II-like n=1 Tax=Trachinotus anak TaxID=443729 RepID=UPI0039F19311
MKSARRNTTEWSAAVNLTVYDRWRFSWYKAVPDVSHTSYSYELLPGSSNGTEQDSYIVHGQTHTAGYVCEAGRGDPVFYTEISEPKFVWSGASLTVSPDRVQHFISEDISLSCEGNSPEWRVRRFPEGGSLSCSDWRRMTGSRCDMFSSQRSDAVYWCESGSGEFSNTVNITLHDDYHDGVILVSPVRPVTEGESVTLGCRFRTEKKLSSVFFYHNDKLIQSDTRTELNISAVSKSDEGFYKCQSSGEVSPQSWMSVKVAVPRPGSSSFPVWPIVGLVCGIVLIVLLLLLYRCRQSKGDISLEAEDAENGEPQDVTYSSIELKNIGKKHKHREPAETSVYSDIKTRPADNRPLYAQVNINTKEKAKKKRGKSAPAATDDSVYSEVKNPGAAFGL